MKFAFGCLQLSSHKMGSIDESKVIEAAEEAIDSGIEIFDTAPIYGLGHSEELLGQIIKHKRHRVKIATKVGLVWTVDNGFKKHIDNSAESINESVEGSLQRLGTDYIDICLLHYPDLLVPIEESMEALYKLRNKGIILNIGYCNLDIKELKKVAQLGDVMVQVAYNLLDREMEGEFLPFCKSHGIKIMVHSPLARGFLSGKYNVDTKFPENDRRQHDPYFKNANLSKVITKISSVAYKYNMYPTQVALQWLVKKTVDHIIFGVKDIEQLNINLESLRIDISKKDLRYLEYD